MSREFHDLAEAALNHESGGRSCWGNLGLWRQARTYPQACTALADALARTVGLGLHSQLIEVGFGCGDSLLHWRTAYGVASIAGLNVSQSQTELARRRLIAAGHHDVARSIHRADARNLPQWASQRRAAGEAGPDTVLALDCAYHFRTRDRFLHDAAGILPAGGQLGAADILLARADLGPRELLPLRAFARVAHMPWTNLQTEEIYRQRWQSAGFEIDTFEDLTADVFLGFDRWLRRYRGCLTPSQRREASWTKYSGTAYVLRWAVRHRVLRFILCAGHKRAGRCG